jgi:hypothetical protein
MNRNDYCSNKNITQEETNMIPKNKKVVFPDELLEDWWNTHIFVS